MMLLPTPALPDSSTGAAPDGPSADMLLETLPWGVVVLGADSTVLRINRQAAAWWGHSQAVVQGQPLSQVPLGQLPATLYNALHQAGRGEDTPPAEYFLPVAQSWLAMATMPLPIGVAVYWQDITPQKLRERQYQTLAENIPDVVMRWNRSRELVYANPAFQDKTGFVVQDMLGKTPLEMGYADDIAKAWIAKVQNVLDTGQSDKHCISIATPNGLRHFSSSFVPEMVDGQVHTVLAVYHEVTEMVEAQNRLVASEALLTAAEEVAHAGSYEADIATMNFRFSDGMFRLFGEEPHSFTPSLEFINSRSHPDDVSVVEQVLNQAIADREPYHYIRRIYRRDGQQRTVESYGSVVCDEDNKPLRLLGLVQDVTERKQAEASLAQASRTIERMLHGSPAAICLLEARRDEQTGQIKDFEFLGVNEAAERLNGKAAAELVGQGLLENFPGVRAVLFDEYRRVVETGEPLRTERFYNGEHFRSRWFDVSAVKNGDGIILTFLDITTRKQGQLEREKNHRLLQQAETVAGMGSWEYEPATNTYTWSVGMYRLFGLPPGTSITPDIYVQMAVEEDRHVAERLVRHIREGLMGREETLRIQADDQVKTLRRKVTRMLDEEGHVVRLLGVDLDVSELRRLEAENVHMRLEQQQALFQAVLQAQEAERRRIAEGLHNGIGQLLYATKLRLDLLQSPDVELAPALSLARQEADMLLEDAIRQTRVLSHELMPVVLEDFGLSVALQKICRSLSSASLQLNYQETLDTQVPPLSATLQLALYRIAQELALNIVKHAHGATEASLELETMPGFVLLRAEDNGPGFPADMAATPGLGLRTIRDRVQLLGGKLIMGSYPTRGSYVRLRIPLPAAEEQQ